MNREIKFKRVFQHEEAGRMCEIMWGNIDSNDEPYKYFEGFKSPAHISGYTVVADRQFTGLKDKSGKEIYEGDVVRYTTPRLDHPRDFKIVFHDGLFCQIEISPRGYVDEGCEANLWIDWEELTVIGNIFENPELLKGEATE